MVDKFILLLILLLIVYFIFRYTNNYKEFLPAADDCGVGEKPGENEIIEAMGQTAKDACNRISSRAEEIKENLEGSGTILKNLPVLSLFNPNNYKAGDNTTKDLSRNIINTNMSSCDVTRIRNSCPQNVASSQINNLTNLECPVLELAKLGIDMNYKNITQENVVEIEQKCIMNSAIETLLKKKSSVDAQAMAEVIQEASGLMSGDNSFVSEKCNVVSQDLSSINYIEDRADCAPIVASDQLNNIEICGSVADTVQKNKFSSLQECLKGTNVDKETEIEGDTKVSSNFKIDQKSVGVGASGSVSSSLCICIILSIIAAVGFGSNEENREKIIKAYASRA